MGLSFSFPRLPLKSLNLSSRNSTLPIEVPPRPEIIRMDSWLCPTCNWRYPSSTPECYAAKCRKIKRKDGPRERQLA
jgi:hypothetical protein